MHLHLSLLFSYSAFELQVFSLNFSCVLFSANFAICPLRISQKPLAHYIRYAVLLWLSIRYVILVVKVKVVVLVNIVEAYNSINLILGNI